MVCNAEIVPVIWSELNVTCWVVPTNGNVVAETGWVWGNLGKTGCWVDWRPENGFSNVIIDFQMYSKYLPKLIIADLD